MAQQNFQRYAYISDNATSYAIRASTKVAGAQATAASAPGADVPTVDTGRGTRGNGVRPRYIRLRRTAGTAPNIKAYYSKLPIFLSADVSAMRATATFTLDGVTWNNAGYVSESVR